MIMASKERPIMICRKCKVGSERVIVRSAPDLRQEKRKTWQRCIKPSDTKHDKVKGKLVKALCLFQCYDFILPKEKILHTGAKEVTKSCIQKRHKIEVRTAPFSTKLITTLLKWPTKVR